MKFFKTISIFFFAILVMVASTDFLIGVHYCMGEVQEVSLFAAGDGCHPPTVPPCHRHASPMDCCDDESFLHSAEDFKVSFEQYAPGESAATDVVCEAFFVAEIVPSSAAARRDFVYYDPPLRSADLTVEHRVLLI